MFAYDVSVLLDITLEEVQLLRTWSAQHYDGVCINAGERGGFLYGWKNHFELGGTDGIYATSRELGTCEKILEISRGCKGTGQLRLKMRRAAVALSEEHCRVNKIQFADTSTQSPDSAASAGELLTPTNAATGDGCTESEVRCACVAGDARACFLARHPAYNRFSDVDGDGLYDAAIDEECECACHLVERDEFEFWD